MPKFANFVQAELTDPISGVVTTIEVQVADPYNPPPDPAGLTARVTIMDSLLNPTKFEIVEYTGRTLVSAGVYELTGCTRGAEGTAGQAFSAGAIVRQDVTAGALALLTVGGQHVYGGSNDRTVRKITEAGREVWKNEDADAAVMSLDVDQYGVYAGLDNGGTAGSLMKIDDADGSLVWRSSSHTYPIRKVMGDGAGNIYSLGIRDDGTIGAELKKHDSSGNQLWSYTEAFWQAQSFTIGDDGYIYVVEAIALLKIHPEGFKLLDVSKSGGGGTINPGPGGFLYAWIDLLIRKYDLALVEEFALDGSASRALAFSVAAVGLKDGSAIVIGEVPTGGDIVKVNSSGVAQWTGTLPGGTFPLNEVVPECIDALPNGDVVYIDGRSDTLYILSGDDGSEVMSFNDFTSIVNCVAAWPRQNAQAVVWNGTEFVVGQVASGDLSNIPAALAGVVLKEMQAPETPATGYAILFLDAADGALKVIFDTGTVSTIATP